MICRLCRVSGRVQGVFYRGSAQAMARRLGITGYARNLPNGDVEVLACGEATALDTFIDWLKVGPVGASVQGVTVTDRDVPEIPSAFTTG